MDLFQVIVLGGDRSEAAKKNDESTSGVENRIQASETVN
jgi:hypothetical protein